MKLAQIEINNFRCFELLKVPLRPDVNVFVGTNAAGKTAILDAIAIGLYDVVNANGGGGKRQRDAQRATLRPTDIHIVAGSPDALVGRKDYVHIRTSATDFYPLRNHPAITPSGENIMMEWEDYIQFRPPNDFDYSTRQMDRFEQYFEDLWDEARVTPKAEIPFPVIAYYRATRRIARMPELGDIFNATMDRAGAFKGALDAGANYQSMCQWFYLRENQELREKLQTREDREFEYPDLKAARSALGQTLENVDRVFFDSNPPSLNVEFAEEGGISKVLALEQLSDGYRNLLAIVLDFARRLAQAHPNWEKPLEAPGILLIDEIELHLHPRWQQRVIPNLRTVFPNTQMIVTTHSPQVLTTVYAENIAIIRNQGLYSTDVKTFGAESKQLMSQIMNTDNRPPDNENVDAIRHLFDLIHNEDLEAADAECQRLMLRMGSDDPALIEAEMLIKNRLWERELDL
jgi:predicted ATP-binding protein involved in virulence